MNQQRPDLRSDLAALAGAEGAAHPPVERLIGYAEDRLPTAEAEALREHLAACPRCARTVLGLAGEPAEAEAVELSADEMSEQWERLRRRVLADRPELAPAPSPRYEETIALAPAAPLRRPKAPRELRLYRALAASLLLTTGAALFWGWSASRPAEPEINLPIVTLRPSPEPTRGAAPTAEEQEVVLPREAEHLALWLAVRPFYDPEAIETIGVELLGADGEVLWRRWGLRRLQPPGFQILLPRARVPQGRYRLRLIGRRADGEEELAAYAFRVEHEPASGR